MKSYSFMYLKIRAGKTFPPCLYCSEQPSLLCMAIGISWNSCSGLPTVLSPVWHLSWPQNNLYSFLVHTDQHTDVAEGKVPRNLPRYSESWASSVHQKWSVTSASPWPVNSHVRLFKLPPMLVEAHALKGHFWPLVWFLKTQGESPGVFKMFFTKKSTSAYLHS